MIGLVHIATKSKRASCVNTVGLTAPRLLKAKLQTISPDKAGHSERQGAIACFVTWNFAMKANAIAPQRIQYGRPAVKKYFVKKHGLNFSRKEKRKYCRVQKHSSGVGPILISISQPVLDSGDEATKKLSLELISTLLVSGPVIL